MFDKSDVKTLFGAFFVTVLCGPPIGGIVVAAWPLMGMFAYGLMQVAITGSFKSALAFATSLVSLIGFAIYESYIFAGITAFIAASAVVARLAQRGGISDMEVGGIAAASVPAGLLIRALLLRDPSNQIVPGVLWGSLLQIIPAMIAGVCSRRLVSLFADLARPS
jgi:hypothetical protein